MHIYGPAHLHGPQSIGPPHGPRSTQPPARPGSEPIHDELQISDAARLTEQARQAPEIRHARVQEIRRQIAEGSYETSHKLDVALERLLDEIG